MPFEPVGSSLVLTVSSEAELLDAYETLSNSEGGGRIELTEGVTGLRLELRDGGNEPVHITSADPENPVALSAIVLRDLENVRVSEVHVDSTGTDFPAQSGGFGLNGVEAVELSNITFTGGATEYYNPDDPDSVLGIGMGSIRDSSDVVFSNNTASGYLHGTSIMESRDVKFLSNEFTEFQGDGLRMGGVQNVLVEGNYFHDFLGTTNDFTHGDMIQLWSTNAEIVSSDITINGNILDSGNGSSSQSIWIRNETYDKGLDDGYIYSNITITNNLIHNSHVHGIAVGHANGVTVEDNTLLWNAATGDPPQIVLSSSWNVTANNNITSDLRLPADAQSEGNVILDYINPYADDYVGNHIINPFAVGGADLADLRLRPDSEYLGTGSEFSDPLLTSYGGIEPVVVVSVDAEDPQTIQLDAGFSVDEDGFLNEANYTFEWEFPDGSVHEGATVSYQFTTPGEREVELRILNDGQVVAEETFGLDVEDDTYLSLSAKHGFEDQSAYDSEVWVSGSEVVDGPEGPAFRIGGDDYFAASSSNEQLHSLQGFDLNLNMSVIDDSAGSFLRMGSTMRAEVEWDGSVWFQLRTDEGTFRVDSGDTHVDDGAFHNIAVSYSHANGTLQLQIDGEVVDEVEAHGTTPPISSNSLIIGSPWNEVVDALVSDVTFAAHADHFTVTPPAPIVEPNVLPAEVVEEEEVAEEGPPPPADDFDVTTADLAALSADQGLSNLSSSGVDLWNSGAEIVDGPQGEAVRIGDGDMFAFSGRSEDMHGLDSFGFQIEMSVIDDSAGSFLRMGSTMRAEVNPDGSVTFNLRTDEGSFEVDSGDTHVDDGAFHNIAVNYSDLNGMLQLQIDGEIVDEVEAYGLTTSSTSNSLMIGSRWEQTVDALIHDVSFTSDPGDPSDAFGPLVGSDTIVTPPAPIIEPNVLPAEVVEEEEVAEEGPPPPADDFDVTTADLAALSADQGLSNLSSSGVDLWNSGAEIVDGPQGEAVRIGDGDMFAFSGRSEDMHGLDSFGFQIEMSVIDDSAGSFLRMGSTMRAEVNPDGSVTFNLRTDEGSFEVDSGDTHVDDGAFHNIAVNYSDLNGMLQLQINGEIVDEVEAYGLTTSSTSNSLMIGSRWEQTVDALIHDVSFTSDPGDPFGQEPTAEVESKTMGIEMSLTSPTALVSTQQESGDVLEETTSTDEDDADLIAALFLPPAGENIEATQQQSFDDYEDENEEDAGMAAGSWW
ncbi:right-handed parallel beta-helix repeat-containing protein [Rhodobacteraceae bacterium N5(2021)]|uniref:Right-handed parallel beta-helix repeat-containing protein n=1 Tax=Gymnodinialimonas phycosphaerae TaxID=2841589 RepID=A0A975TZ61_9RHOB|nr:LamG-like jellyroll fold domain-containing protein [Gymnodinialimonas phycosphaerae]MBY4895364.1 right-handed parallel beta-helix repeat-containing protein [Gymnodinialimonas phycosphaerae]